MLNKYPSGNHGKANHGWLKSLFHFSFAEYYNPERMNFGVLRVVNDDLVATNTGFAMHPHRDMEIVSYVIDGELTHEDSMGNKNNISRGHIQYMSAGTGVVHSEHNFGIDPLRFLQIWINPNQTGLEPYYGDYKFDWNLRKNRLLHMVSPKAGGASVKIHSDASLYALELDKGLYMDFNVGVDRQVYLIQIEGASDVNGLVLNAKDAAESVEESLVIKALETSHLLIVEMKKA
ncbi:pirin family protein [Pelosinus sp. UFO1]|uniref:pirin family protein n=1 Tax=Pelosinus sp. UFO1 TaxID=484770 RepID=UPI0004D1708F|nr:pirin family protein [Pelosinus sp. UFO1]AIF54174.1 Pirin domain protein [Pelosinus sp. UFO1]